MKNRFEVSTEGMRELQSGREPWQLAKELVSNAWDEKAALCQVELRSETSQTAYFSVYDDGSGFKDVADAWTLMKHTDKRMDPEVRGRFNIGEKEILAVARSARITTSNTIILFPADGGRQVKKSPKPTVGTLVETWLPWGSDQVRDTLRRLSLLMPPPGITYRVNGHLIKPQKPYKSTQAVLETVIQRRPGEPLATTRRKAELEIYQGGNGNGSQLYEMGVPVQALDCPYSVNVLQKIPLPPNRDAVKASYLQDVYAAVLGVTADTVEDPCASWTKIAMEDKDISPEAVKSLIRRRYGDKVALWSSDTRSNEKAQLEGYDIVHGRTLSAKERKLFSEVGVRSASDIFPIGNRPRQFIDDSKLTSGMISVKAYAEQLHEALFLRPVSVRFYNDITLGFAAEYGTGELFLNVGRLGKSWFDSIDERTTSLLLHEFAHTKGVGHEPSYYRSLEELAGRAVHLALEHPEVFRVEVVSCKGVRDG